MTKSETNERNRKCGLIWWTEAREELLPSEYLAREPEKTIEEQLADIFREEATA